jgi:hypothetical protein
MPVSKSRKKRASKTGKNRTPLLDHKKVGKVLEPGFAQFGDKLTFSSWSNERLPEMLWAAIIRIIDDQDYAILEFRRVIEFVGNHKQKEKLSDLTISGIAKLDEDIRNEFLGLLVTNPLTASALTVLTLFENLPARESWLKYLPSNTPNIDVLMKAVGMCLPHQSQEATDCRWLKVMLTIVSGKFHAQSSIIDELADYPYKGELRSVRPIIRACEMAKNPMIKDDLTWSNYFWNEAWVKSPCLKFITDNSEVNTDVICTQEDVVSLRKELKLHWSETHSTTDIDAKHDGSFGIAFYVLTVLEELLVTGISTGILGRLGLRTIFECHVSFRYLILKNNKELWKKWRTYGAGQAKLNALKFDEFTEPPKFINTETIESIAGEDLWEEFLNIELGSWSGSDLRKMSDKAGVKPSYDQYYSWTSGYSHGTWGAIREACFETCGNPVHRLHRYPKKKSLPDTLHDACTLVNEILEDLDKAYPDFKLRLLIPK